VGAGAGGAEARRSHQHNTIFVTKKKEEEEWNRPSASPQAWIGDIQRQACPSGL
jgi:hypothetical protein